MSVPAIERVDCVYETECLGGMYRNGGLSQATSYEGVTVVVRLIYTIHRTLCFPIIDHRADCSSVPHALIYLICLNPPPPPPLYPPLSELLNVYTPSRTLRSSSDTRMLEIQQYKRKTHGFRTFSCFGPHIWNSLPQDLRHCATLSSFKAKLKTFLFSQYFHPN